MARLSRFLRLPPIMAGQNGETTWKLDLGDGGRTRGGGLERVSLQSDESSAIEGRYGRHRGPIGLN